MPEFLDIIYMALLVIALGIVVFIFMKTREEHYVI